MEAPPRAALPWRMAADPDKPTLSERFTRAVIKADSRPSVEDEGPQTVEELEAAVAHADDTERLIGLAAAPLAGLVAILVVSSIGTKAGKPTSSVDSTLTLVLFGLAIIMLVSAWFRKRLYLGIACALYGLSIFNLHYWEFGIPFLLIGSWYLVRAYRLSQKLKLAKAEGVHRLRAIRWSGDPAGPTEQALHPTGHRTAQADQADQAGASRRRPTTDGSAPCDHPGDPDGHRCASHGTRQGPAGRPGPFG